VSFYLSIFLSFVAGISLGLIFNTRAFVWRALVGCGVGILFMLSYLKFGNSVDTVIFDAMIAVCIGMIVSDVTTYVVRDFMLIISSLLSLVFVYNNDIDIYYSILSGIIYFCVILGSTFFLKKKKDVIGSADIKFIAICGLVLGVNLLPLFLFLSGLIGIVFGIIWKKKVGSEYFPFYPALVSSFLLLIFLAY